MTADQFAYWLQGYAELNDAPPSVGQWQVIRDHLALVFDSPFAPMPSPSVAPHDFGTKTTRMVIGGEAARDTC